VRRGSAILALAVAISAAASACPAATIEDSGISVTFSEGEERYAREVLDVCRHQAKRMRTRLGLELPSDLTVTLVGGDEFEDELGPGRAKVFSAFARPSEREVVLHMGKLRPAAAAGFSRTMRHELVHIAVGELVREKGGRLPLWFDEGLAMLYGDMPFERDARMLTAAVAAGTLFPLSELAARFPSEDPQRVHLAYLQAEDATRFVITRRDEAALRGLLVRLGTGEGFDDSLLAVYGTGAAGFEQQWRNSLSTGSGVLDWARALLTSFSLFFYLALLMLVAFVVQYFRRRRRKEQMDAEL